ncbi:preprotein translocase subunit YajC [Varibaculum cambriense]|uniref:preprotein translocase subunit YajC n=1 Tax=Varibaculum cambriense TaxID=184870 RepID=UPI00290C3492|nr:preprotein translocase subunit YajC [Varibaculum cambriense]MDU5542729.1 preprotein translocase subunit YajC [Varibaculum cambriense]
MGSGVLLAVIGAFLLMMIFSSRNAKKKQAEQRDKLANDMVPGAWVMTTSGFYGRYVDTDGDVIVLETSDGTETLWTSRAIVSVGNPPFAPDTADTNAEDAGDASADKADSNEEAKDPAVESSTEETPVDEEKNEGASSDSESSENN